MSQKKKVIRLPVVPDWLIYSIVSVAITWLIIFLIIISPKSEQGVTFRDNVAHVPYGSTLIISAGKSTMAISPSDEIIDTKIYLFVFVPYKQVEYSENTVIHWGPFVDLKVKKVSGGIELTKPWFARFH